VIEDEKYSQVMIGEAASRSGIFNRINSTVELAKFLACFEKLRDAEKDPEAWREEYERRQNTGERFDYFSRALGAWDCTRAQWTFRNPIDSKEQFRLHGNNAWREEYRKKQAAGVLYEKLNLSQYRDFWVPGRYNFFSNKERYREVKQPQNEYSSTPHAKERALYWSQRAEGTNEVWQVAQGDECFADIAVDQEPQWQIACQYRVKPKTVTYYFCLMKFNSCGLYEAKVFSSVEHAQNYEHAHQCTIIGDIESREVEVG